MQRTLEFVDCYLIWGSGWLVLRRFREKSLVRKTCVKIYYNSAATFLCNICLMMDMHSENINNPQNMNNPILEMRKRG